MFLNPQCAPCQASSVASPSCVTSSLSCACVHVCLSVCLVPCFWSSGCSWLLWLPESFSHFLFLFEEKSWQMESFKARRSSVYAFTSQVAKVVSNWFEHMHNWRGAFSLQTLQSRRTPLVLTQLQLSGGVLWLDDLNDSSTAHFHMPLWI